MTAHLSKVYFFLKLTWNSLIIFDVAHHLWNSICSVVGKCFVPLEALCRKICFLGNNFENKILHLVLVASIAFLVSQWEVLIQLVVVTNRCTPKCSLFLYNKNWLKKNRQFFKFPNQFNHIYLSHSVKISVIWLAHTECIYHIFCGMQYESGN